MRAQKHLFCQVGCPKHEGPPKVYLFSFRRWEQDVHQGFAWMEAVVILATGAGRFELSLLEDFSTLPHPGFTLRPKDHVVMHVKSRDEDPYENSR